MQDYPDTRQEEWVWHIASGNEIRHCHRRTLPHGALWFPTREEAVTFILASNN